MRGKRRRIVVAECHGITRTLTAIVGLHTRSNCCSSSIHMTGAMSGMHKCCMLPRSLDALNAPSHIRKLS